MRRIRTLTLMMAVMLLPGVGLSHAATSASAANGPVPPGMHVVDGFYTFDQLPVVLTNTYQVMEQGTRAADGSCLFETRMTIQPGSPGIAQQEVAYNPSTCQRLMQRGTPPGAVARPLSFCFYPCHDKGHAFAKFTDIVGITVTSETSWTDWWWNNSCVVAPVTNTKQNYVAPTGWLQFADAWNNSSYNCTYTVADAYALDINRFFCVISDTDTVYWNNGAYGWWNGNLSGYWKNQVEGICGGSFHYYQDLRYDF